MKYIIASDIHGSSEAVAKILEIKEREKADKIILLGDIYNHGPRNPFPSLYSPMEVANLLNVVKEDLIVIKGNCDSEVDTLVSDFDFLENAVLDINGKTLFLSHGHIYNKDNPPKTKFNAIIYGHFHTGFIEEKDGVLYINAGSVALPKNGTPKSLLIVNEKEIALQDLDGKVLDSVKI